MHETRNNIKKIEEGHHFSVHEMSFVFILDFK